MDNDENKNQDNKMNFQSMIDNNIVPSINDFLREKEKVVIDNECSCEKCGNLIEDIKIGCVFCRKYNKIQNINKFLNKIPKVILIIFILVSAFILARILIYLLGYLLFYLFR